jgi:hypothetical protein
LFTFENFHDTVLVVVVDDAVVVVAVVVLGFLPFAHW